MILPRKATVLKFGVSNKSVRPVVSMYSPGSDGDVCPRSSSADSRSEVTMLPVLTCRLVLP